MSSELAGERTRKGDCPWASMLSTPTTVSGTSSRVTSSRSPTSIPRSATARLTATSPARAGARPSSTSKAPARSGSAKSSAYASTVA
jgi:hypothetical protein